MLVTFLRGAPYVEICHHLEVILLCLISVCGLAGNIVAVLGNKISTHFLFLFFKDFSVLRGIRRRRSPAFLCQFHQYLTVLAIVDSFLILMYLLDNVIVGHISMSNNQWFYTVIPYLTHPIKSISITMSMVWLVIIAIERFMAVAHPFNDQDRFSRYIIFLISFSVMVNFTK